MNSYSQDNIESLFRAIGETSGNPVYVSNEYSAVITPKSYWPNVIFNIENNIQVIDSIIRKYANNEFPLVLMTNPLFQSKEFIDRLKKKYKNSEWAAMYIPIKSQNAIDVCSSFVVRENTSVFEMQSWYTIVEHALMNNKNLNRNIFNSLLLSERCIFFTGYYLAKPVSTAMLYIDKGVAGIYLVATDESFRGNGFACSIMSHVLAKAYNAKCTKIVLQATNKGVSLYEKIGFIHDGNIYAIDLAQQC